MKKHAEFVSPQKRRHAPYVVGREEKGPLCGPGSELLLGGRAHESSARIINGMQQKKRENNTSSTVAPPYSL